MLYKITVVFIAFAFSLLAGPNDSIALKGNRFSGYAYSISGGEFKPISGIFRTDPEFTSTLSKDPQSAQLYGRSATMSKAAAGFTVVGCAVALAEVVSAQSAGRGIRMPVLAVALIPVSVGLIFELKSNQTLRVAVGTYNTNRRLKPE